LAKAGMATTQNSQGATLNASALTPSHGQGTSTPLSVAIGSAYERFLEMPVAFVLGVMWLAGAVLMGSCALALYLVVSALI
jgi:hypothetical protein